MSRAWNRQTTVAPFGGDIVELFDERWAEAWGEEIRASGVYRAAAANWESPVVLEMMHESGSRAVYADLYRGECRVARVATADECTSAPVVISASHAVWLDLLAGKLDPILALMTGRLRLRRGTLASLMPYTAAAKEMVAAAVRLEARRNR